MTRYIARALQSVRIGAAVNGHCHGPTTADTRILLQRAHTDLKIGSPPIQALEIGIHLPGPDRIGRMEVVRYLSVCGG